MIKIENVEVFGWGASIRGMRNPKNSWAKSDSGYVIEYDEGGWDSEVFEVGDNDIKLMETLSKAGNDHGKYLRYLIVQLDITAPLYWWKEFKTYRKGRKFMDDGDEFLDPEEFEMFIETNSCSTMHKIHSKEFELDDFSHEHLTYYSHDGELCIDWLGDLEDLINVLNFSRAKYLETKDKCYWWQMIQLLPSSYNQKRTVQLNYQVLKNMYHARKNHKLDEWVDFCKWCETLPYFKEICIN